jgi:hypothetical protein
VLIYILTSKKEIETKINENTDHPRVAATLEKIAEQWKNIGDFQKALTHLERALGKKR